jgi:hypothetical protein
VATLGGVVWWVPLPVIKDEAMLNKTPKVSGNAILTAIVVGALTTVGSVVGWSVYTTMEVENKISILEQDRSRFIEYEKNDRHRDTLTREKVVAMEVALKNIINSVEEIKKDVKYLVSSDRRN